MTMELSNEFIKFEFIGKDGSGKTSLIRYIMVCFFIFFKLNYFDS